MSKTEQTALSVKEQQRRREAIIQAVAQVRLEGPEPDAVFFTYAERYIQGEITLAEAVADYVSHMQARE